ncbi:MAG TPA: universal stress protein [Flavisolibacter sp.]|nr:universal stress protein [Flavisolibacter sp.]
MKTIAVATDFSPAAENATMYAAKLAQSLGASVLIIHAYQVPVSMNDAPVLMVQAEDLSANAEQNLQRAKAALQDQFPQLEIRTESRLGDVVDEVTILCKELQPLFLVIGRHFKSGVEGFIFGSSSLSLIRHCKTPVISVPDAASAAGIKNIAVAIDDPRGALPARIAALLKPLGATIHFVHVREEGEEELDATTITGDLKVPYTSLPAESFVEAIQRFVQQYQIDLLCVLPHRHSVIERWLFKTHTSKLIHKLSLPILCIPA